MTTHEAFEGPLPDGWQGGEPVTKRWNGNFIHLYRVHRPCAHCGAKISLDVSKRALRGEAKNSGLLLRNCPTCRELRRAGGPGSRGGKSRPMVEGAPAQPIDDVERLQMVNNTMRAELDGLYAQNRDLRERLARYELPAAMAAEARKEKLPWL